MNNGEVGNTASITLTAGDNITSGTIDLTGIVKFTDLSNASSTIIDGSNIKTGTITADKIQSGAITADKIQAGAITVDELSASKITAGTTNAAVTFTNVTATGGKIGGWNLTSTSLKSANYNEGSTGFIGLWTSYPDDSNYRLRIGPYFSVKNTGHLRCTSGNIGAWSFSPENSGYLTITASDNTLVFLGPDGITCNGLTAPWWKIVSAANKV